MSDFRKYLDEQMKDSDFKAEWDATEPEAQIVKAMLDGRKKKNITQKELAELTGIAQADISRLENGNGNPSINTLERIAQGLGMKLKLEFVPG